MLRTKRIVVGFSGGIDSTAAALILKEEGYDVIAVALDFLGDSSLLEKSRTKAKQIGVDYHSVDCREAFESTVIHYFKTSYLNGYTPNPCVYCDQMMKIPMLLKSADTLGAKHVATGHYVQKFLQNQTVSISKSQDSRRDQSYYFYNMDQTTLKRLQFPLSRFASKKDVINYLMDRHVAIDTTDESRGICFIPDNDYGRFLQRDLPVTSRGQFVDIQGNVLGWHNGYFRYTLGQKKNLCNNAKGLAVVGINPDKNQVILGKDALLNQHCLKLSDVRFISGKSPAASFVLDFVACKWGTVHRGRLTMISERDGLLFDFDKPVRAPAPGQFAVFYDGDTLLGGGVIEK